MTPAQIIRAAIPDADDATCEAILWGRTPFPMGAITARSLYKAASGSVRAGRNGRQLCDWCNRIAVNRWTCERCDAALSQGRDHQ